MSLMLPTAPVENVEPTDRELADRWVQSADERAFEQLVIRYRRLVFSICRRYCHSEQDAEEVTNDVLVKLRSYLPRFQRRCSFTTLLHYMGRSHSWNRCRSESVRGAGRKVSITEGTWFRDDDGHLVLLDRLLSERSCEETADNRELAAVIAQFIPTLSPKLQPVFRLRVDEQLDYNQIAERLNICVGSVKSRLSRGRDSLVRAIAEHRPEMAASLRHRQQSLVH